MSKDWRRFTQRGYIDDAKVNHLIGLATGIVCDGVITEEEVGYLADWLEDNRRHADIWPFNVLYPRIGMMLEDGILDPEEEGELLGILAELTGVGKVAGLATTLPVNQPMPPLEFEGRAYVLTGTFLAGPRSHVRSRLEERGAIYKGSFSNKVDYLVIGKLVTPAWAHESYGRKIEAAAIARDRGHHVVIVTEDHLIKHW